VDLKAEYPPFNLNEIANIVQACFGRKPDVRSVARVLAEEPVPLKIVRNYPPYHEIADPREGRAAIVELRLSGWSAKAIEPATWGSRRPPSTGLWRGGKKGGSRA
jgi:hypothetical protein